MNTAQKKTIRTYLLELKANCKRVGKTDLKRISVHKCGSFVSVCTTYGLPSDEGTAASIFCRDERQVFIGKRGGIKLADPKSSNHSQGMFWSVRGLIKNN